MKSDKTSGKGKYTLTERKFHVTKFHETYVTSDIAGNFHHRQQRLVAVSIMCHSKSSWLEQFIFFEDNEKCTA